MALRLAVAVAEIKVVAMDVDGDVYIRAFMDIYRSGCECGCGGQSGLRCSYGCNSGSLNRGLYALI